MADLLGVNNKKYVIGIDASRNRSGGAKVHLIGILNNLEPDAYNISKIHVWSYKALLDCLPDRSWLIKHNPPELEQNLFKQIYWQRLKLPKVAKKLNIDILLNTDAGSVCRFRPCITMSRDMLEFEPSEMKRYPLSLSKLRLIALKHVQKRAFKLSDGVIFLTRYAAEKIGQQCKIESDIAIIPHGISEIFRSINKNPAWQLDKGGPIKCIYISVIELYKHQWNVVKAIEALRKIGYDIQVEFIGGGKGLAKKLLEKQIQRSDPNHSYVKVYDFLSHKEIVEKLKNSDIFIFASSCENMPNILLEGMATGLPIACSNKGPMPEILKDGGVYFNPEDYCSIASALEYLINNKEKRIELSRKAKEISLSYSWERCSKETFCFIKKIIERRI
jgi:glycosyltransferase involved in cell wall biosynthesis